MKQNSEPRKKEVHVATYNIHGWVGRDKRRDPERVIKVIRALQCTIIALQEVTLELSGRHGSEQYLAQSTGLQVVSGPTLYDERGSYGNVLLTEHPVTRVRRLDLSQPGREPRGALEVGLLVHGQEMKVITCHLGLMASERRKQMNMLLDFIGTLGDYRMLLLGDINEWRPRSPLLNQVDGFFGCSPCPLSFPARLPLLALDRIWANPNSMLKKVYAARSQLARQASDHLPVKALLDLSSGG